MSITPPYRECPECKKADSFGFYANSMQDNTDPKMYTQKCSVCGHRATYFLPPLDKKIIYLDQFALSEMLKSIDPSVPRRGTLNPIWRTLFNKLEQLSRKQLLVCPKSTYHNIESLPTTFYSKFQTLIEYLSWHVSFHRPNSIKMRQVEKHARLWIQGEDDKEPAIEHCDAFRGRINYWYRWNNLIKKGDPHPWEIAESQRRRATNEAEIASLYDGWRSESKSQEQWFSEPKSQEQFTDCLFHRITRLEDVMIKEDYWGNLTTKKPKDSPRQILEEQVAFLEDKTENQLTGSVASLLCFR